MTATLAFFKCYQSIGHALWATRLGLFLCFCNNLSINAQMQNLHGIQDLYSFPNPGENPA